MAATDGPTLFTTLLATLGVPHTAGYSSRRFRSMPFKSLFGLSKLLESYGIDNTAVRLSRKEEYPQLPTPFVAQVDHSFVIVTDNRPGVPVATISAAGTSSSIAPDSFLDRWSGVALLTYPNPTSAEPDFATHRREEIAAKAKTAVLAASGVFLLAYLFISRGLYSHISTILLALINAGGLYITYLLVLKQMSVHSKAADRVCGVLQATGCNTVLQTKAAKFFGLFGWSEVGFAYFGVSLLTLLIFPQYIGYLALANACCLPFSFWSVWYQKNRAKAWCTLCLCVQASLWLLFFCYLAGGWFRFALPIRIELFVLGAAYLAALLTINRTLPIFERNTRVTSPSNP